MDQQRPPTVMQSDFEKEAIYFFNELSANLNMILYGISAFIGIMAIAFTAFFGIYILLWVLDYNEVIETNPVHDLYSLIVSWLRSIERIDILGYPIRLGKLIFWELKFHDQYGLDDTMFAILFFALFYPTIYDLYGFFRVPMLIMMPLLITLYMVDRDMFIFPESAVKDEYGYTDTTYLARDGVPYLLTRFYQLTTLLIFNGGQALQEAFHGTPENADEFFGFNYQESRLNMRILKEMVLVAVVFPFAMPLMNFWVGPWSVFSFFGIIGLIFYEVIFLDVDLEQASVFIPEEDLPNY